MAKHKRKPSKRRHSRRKSRLRKALARAPRRRRRGRRSREVRRPAMGYVVGRGRIRRRRLNPKPVTYTLVFKHAGFAEPMLRVLGASLARQLRATEHLFGQKGMYFRHPRFMGTRERMASLREQVLRVLAYEAGRRRLRFDSAAAVLLRPLPR